MSRLFCNDRGLKGGRKGGGKKRGEENKSGSRMRRRTEPKARTRKEKTLETSETNKEVLNKKGEKCRKVKWRENKKIKVGTKEKGGQEEDSCEYLNFHK